jgi:hypothetical protein
VLRVPVALSKPRRQPFHEGEPGNRTGAREHGN